MAHQVELAPGQTMLQVLRSKYGEALELSQEFPADPSSGFEGGRFLNSIRGILEPINPPNEQYLKILTPSGRYCLFGVDHMINPEKGDEVGTYTLEIEDVVKNN